MHSIEDIEMQLWDYLDGRCTDGQLQRIRRLLDTDTTWQQKYQELAAIHQLIQQNNTEQPSMRFSKNVMEHIAGTAIAKPAHKYISNRVIGSIGALFLILIAATLGYEIVHTNWQGTVTTTDKLDLSFVQTSYFINTVLFIIILLTLVFIDSLFRRSAHKNI